MNTQKFKLHGIKYEAPQSEVEAAALPPKSRLFVRLAPAGTDFHLILDEWSEFASYQGSDIPRISRLNDNRFQKFSVIRSPSGPVVCTDRQPHFNCGLSIEDGPVRWSVLFDKKHLPRSEEIRLEAQAKIREYRVGDADRS